MHTLNRESGQTIILVTHNAAIAQIADRVIHISNGAVHNVETNPAPIAPRALSW
jgi:putative ABC transport system ATP-binding protein